MEIIDTDNTRLSMRWTLRYPVWTITCLKYT